MLPNKSRSPRKVRKVNGPERTHGLQGRSEGNLPDLRPLSRTILPISLASAAARRCADHTWSGVTWRSYASCQ
jgi:hypothetical protein